MRLRHSSSEDTIQRAVFQHLRARKAPNVFAFHVANGGKRKPIEAAILKGLGVTAGVRDIIAIRGGHTYALELKGPGGRLSENQLRAQWMRCARPVRRRRLLSGSTRRSPRWSVGKFYEGAPHDASARRPF
jgi:hypothetical protein